MQVLADFGHSLVLLSNKGQSKIELEMRDLALMLDAAGIIQVPGAGVVWQGLEKEKART